RRPAARRPATPRSAVELDWVLPFADNRAALAVVPVAPVGAAVTMPVRRGAKMAFDPNAATARYIDSLGPAALQKAHDYTIGREWMLLWSLVVAAVVTWLIVRSGVLDRTNAIFGEKRRNLRALVVTGVYLLVSAILTMPWTIYANWWRETRYDRTSQPFGDFLWQNVLATVISAL